MKNNIFKISIILIVIVILIGCKGEKKIKSAIYQDATKPLEARVEDLVKRMTLEQKIAQLAGHGMKSDEDTVLGIPGFRMTDGPSGLVWTGQASAFPAGVALAASWDTSNINSVANAIAIEAKGRGINMLLAPCTDIQRLPVGGRNFETYSEDPYLASQMVVAYVKGVEKNKVITCTKHFVCENIQFDRFGLNQNVSERALQEIYFPAFKAAVQVGKTQSLMASYYKINGSLACENKYLLKDMLKNDWGFDGFVVSDWNANRSTVEAANNGLDLEMPQPDFFGDSLLKAVKNGKVPVSEIDDKVKRIIRVKMRAGMFENKPTIDEKLVNSDYSKKIALESAKNGIVLLKNENNILPLDKSKIKSIAVIGPNAKTCRPGGGGSSSVTPYYTVSPLEGITNMAGNDIKINYALGDVLEKPSDLVPIDAKYFFQDELKTKPGLKLELWNSIEMTGDPEVVKTADKIDFDSKDLSPDSKIRGDMWGARYTGYLISPNPVKFKIMTLSDDGVRLWIDDKLLIDNWDFHGAEKDSVEILLDQNKPHKIKLDFFDGQMGALIKLGWDYASGSAQTEGEQLIADAVAAAKASDVAVVFVGLANFLESEGADVNEKLRLPNNQDALIKAVAKANPNTIVVLNTGAPIYTGKWLSSVAGFVDAFYLGQETGNAIASVLFGETNPSAKLPFTYIAKKADCPFFEGYKNPSRSVDFKEGIFVGYRYYDKHNVTPLYPFGYGLSYTTFNYSNLEIKEAGNYNYSVSFDITNTGNRAGSEVAQLYVRDLQSTVERPEKELKSFGKVMLQPNETKRVTLTLNKDAFTYYDDIKHQWTLESGDFELLVGKSSRDIVLKRTILVK
ncbi:MAG: glycoside hydrolase family 3 C-terminal domain-containing protein [Bacteroidota bacterium]|nr:glycoside hydrolase family 3 C-terminal domain-containing protein [Bacteroidota bacterium]